jgi:hypothetical protein
MAGPRTCTHGAMRGRFNVLALLFFFVETEKAVDGPLYLHFAVTYPAV